MPEAPDSLLERIEKHETEEVDWLHLPKDHSLWGDPVHFKTWESVAHRTKKDSPISLDSKIFEEEAQSQASSENELDIKIDWDTPKIPRPDHIGDPESQVWKYRSPSYKRAPKLPRRTLFGRFRSQRHKNYYYISTSEPYRSEHISDKSPAKRRLGAFALKILHSPEKLAHKLTLTRPARAHIKEAVPSPHSPNRLRLSKAVAFLSLTAMSIAAPVMAHQGTNEQFSEKTPQTSTVSSEFSKDLLPSFKLDIKTPAETQTVAAASPAMTIRITEPGSSVYREIKNDLQDKVESDKLETAAIKIANAFQATYPGKNLGLVYLNEELTLPDFEQHIPDELIG